MNPQTYAPPCRLFLTLRNMPIRIGKIAELRDNGADSHASLLAAIARSAEELTSGKGWPEGVIDLMADLGRITKVSRVWIFQTIELTDDYIIQDYPFEWADKDEHVQLTMPRFSMSRRALKGADPAYLQLIESRKRGEWQAVMAHELEDGWLKRDQKVQGILSMLTIPIMVEGEWWGTLGFDDCERAYEWSEVEIALLRTASFLIANAIIRDRLSAKTKQFEILRSITESTAWELDFRKGHFWCGPEILNSMAGLTDNLHMTGLEFLRLVHPQDRAPLMASVKRHLQQGDRAFRRDLRIATDCGNYVWIEAIGKLSLDANGKPTTMAGIAVNILKRKEEEERLRLEAMTDPLTGAVNRGVFDSQLLKLWSAYIATGESFTLLLLDLDHFKSINDSFGHDVGDAVLKHVTQTCRKALRATDILARIGGEEFAVLLPATDAQAGKCIGERIRNDIAATPLTHDKGQIFVTASIGLAGLPNSLDVRTQQQFFKLADYALYVAKRGGRNRLVASDGLDIDTACTL